jgi:hypothetical protein
MAGRNSNVHCAQYRCIVKSFLLIQNTCNRISPEAGPSDRAKLRVRFGKSVATIPISQTSTLGPAVFNLSPTIVRSQIAIQSSSSCLIRSISFPHYGLRHAVSHCFVRSSSWKHPSVSCSIASLLSSLISIVYRAACWRHCIVSRHSTGWHCIIYN